MYAYYFIFFPFFILYDRVLFNQDSYINSNAVLPAGHAIILTPAVTRYPFTPGWRVADVELSLAKVRQ